MKLINYFFIGNIENLDINWEFVNSIPEFNILNNTEQNAVWHKEGNVMKHTKLVCDAMKNFLSTESFNINKNVYLMLSALFHDIGKGPTTKIGDDGLYHSKNHASVGEKITRKILWDIDFEMREKICSLVASHMRPLYIMDKENPIRNIIELSMKCTISDLLVLKSADCIGAINDDITWHDTLSLVKEMANKLNCFNNPYHFFNDNCKFKFFTSLNLEMPPVYDYEKYDLKVIFMCGLPGAGKDTYIKNNLPNIPVICRDDIRKEIGLKGEKPMGNKKEESKVTEIVNERIKNYCRNKTNFIINATNIRKIHREQLINLILPYNPYIEIIYIESPSINDNLLRRKGQISDKVILEMQRNFDFPKETECHKLTLVKQ